MPNLPWLMLLVFGADIFAQIHSNAEETAAVKKTLIEKGASKRSPHGIEMVSEEGSDRTSAVSHRSAASGVPAWMKAIGVAYSGYPSQVRCALKHMSEAYREIQSAKFKNCDKFFRCRGNKRAAKCGLYSKLLAAAISYDIRWQTAGAAISYGMDAEQFGRKGGDCLTKYVYGTLRKTKECWIPYQYQ